MPRRLENSTCFSPTGFPSRMVKKFASGILASFRGSTYRSVRLCLFARCGLAWDKARPQGKESVLADAREGEMTIRVGRAEKAGLFEPPADIVDC